MGLAWKDGESAALNRQGWHRSMAQCVQMDAGWITVKVKQLAYAVKNCNNQRGIMVGCWLGKSSDLQSEHCCLCKGLGKSFTHTHTHTHGSVIVLFGTDQWVVMLCNFNSATLAVSFHSGDYVLPGICLSVCLLATSCSTVDRSFIQFYRGRTD